VPSKASAWLGIAKQFPAFKVIVGLALPAHETTFLLTLAGWKQQNVKSKLLPVVVSI
jgi:hypothetical protein